MNKIKWSEAEEKIIQKSFEIAYQREITALMKEVQDRAGQITELQHLWELHDFLSARRHGIDGKYDYEYSTVVFVFAQLLKEGWLHLDEIQGLNSEMLSKISALARM